MTRYKTMTYTVTYWNANREPHTLVLRHSGTVTSLC